MLLPFGRRTHLPRERMTPIKIRGKKGQKARLRAQREERAVAEEMDMTSSSAALDVELVPSKLECLPTEIIESIFLYSRNLDLPRASLALGRTLSSTGFKHLVLRAFLVDPYLEQLLTHETGELQSALLRCRWVDEAMFTHALRQVRLLKMTDFFQNIYPPYMAEIQGTARHKALLGPGCPVADTSTATIAQFAESIRPKSGRGEEERWEWVCQTNQKVILYMPAYPGRAFCGCEATDKDVWGRPGSSISEFRLAYGCKIPSKVLHGPWTEVKLGFLHALMNASAELDWETSNNGEVAEMSLREAIMQGNTPLLHVLLSIPDVGLSDPDPVFSSWWYHTSITITQEHLRLAIFEGGCNTKIIDMLLHRGRDCGLRLDDDDMLDLAIAKDEEGDERGKWLLHKIKDWEPDKVAVFESWTGPMQDRWIFGNCKDQLMHLTFTFCTEPSLTHRQLSI
ncbi:MAG: hypothetical protein Q9171_007515 [Xanthocarpia ochracea]